MSKLAAVLVPTFTILIISVSWLPASFDPILNWFGPFLGSSFELLLAMIFFAFASPLAYGAVFTGWAVTGMIVGLFARGLRPAISAALLVFTMTYAILGVSLGAVLLSLNKSGILQGNLPPVPPGTTTASLLNIPVFKQFAPLFLSGISGAGSALGSFNLSSLLGAILPSLIGGFLILVGFAVITGFALGRFTKMLRPGKKTGIKPSEKQLQPTSQPIRIIAKAGAMTMILILGLSVGICSAGAASPSSFYAESVLALANPDGSATNYYAYLSSQFQVGSLSTSSQGSDLIAGVVGSQTGSLSFLPQSIASDLSNYISLVPSTLVVLVYDGTCSSTATEANSASADYASAFGISDIAALISRQVTLDQNYPNVCVYAYQSQKTLSAMAATFEDSIVPAISGEGLSTVFESGLSSGFLVPGETSSSVNSSAIFAGYFSTSILSEIPVIGQELSPSAPQGVLGIVAGVAKQDSVFHSSSTQHSASFGALTDYTGKIAFSNLTQFSLAGIAVPLPGSNNTSSIPDLTNYNYTVITTNPALLTQVVGQGQTIMNLSPGNSVTESTLQTIFSKLMPAYLSIQKTLTPNSDGTLTVVLTVVNKDSDSLTNLVMNDTAFTDAYSNSMSIVSGNPLDNVSVLTPSGVAAFTYTVKLSGIGTYSSYPAILTYDLNGTKFAAFSNAAYYNATQSTGLSAVGMLAGSLSSLTNGGTPNATVADLFIALFVGLFLLAGFFEFRAFKKWRAAG